MPEKTESIQSVKVENARILYGKPDNEVIITPKMMHYQNVFEILRGRVPGVQVITSSAPGDPVGYFIIFVEEIQFKWALARLY